MEKNEILLMRGTAYADMTRRILEAADVTALVPDRHARIGIKPNLVVAAPASGGATTHPEIVEGVVCYLREQGCDNFCVLSGHRQRICIGQGYREQSGEIGVGRCTAGCRLSLSGCPPAASEMLAFLEDNWQ